MKEKIARWFKLGLWTEEMVMNAVKKNVLTEEEANEILGTSATSTSNDIDNNIEGEMAEDLGGEE